MKVFSGFGLLLVLAAGTGCKMLKPGAAPSKMSQPQQQQSATAAPQDEMPPESKVMVEYAIVSLAISQGHGALGDLGPPPMSDALKDRITKFVDGLPKGSGYYLDSKMVQSKLDGSENKIMPAGKVEIKFTGTLRHDLVITGGTIGIEKGETYATDGTVATIDQVRYTASKGRWIKK
jgi:hypothetical protein